MGNSTRMINTAITVCWSFSTVIRAEERSFWATSILDYPSKNSKTAVTTVTKITSFPICLAIKRDSKTLWKESTLTSTILKSHCKEAENRWLVWQTNFTKNPSRTSRWATQTRKCLRYSGAEKRSSTTRRSKFSKPGRRRCYPTKTHISRIK